MRVPGLKKYWCQALPVSDGLFRIDSCLVEITCMTIECIEYFINENIITSANRLNKFDLIYNTNAVDNSNEQHNAVMYFFESVMRIRYKLKSTT